ncbi:response regulator [Arthrobacter agilis]|uniref:response regulator n=1 Tax=Arthrobacter agilis TaxID=37921 RepID=UPI0023652B2A|nr:response regulator [Arthrobacter agilis]WDF32731.1 response regulator [Arthrobacter agilis]
MTRVLVVDDEPQLLRALEINLRAHGYQCATAVDGETALAAVSEHHPDIIVLDLGLPDLDGVDVIRRIRGWSQVHIIVLSARHGSQDKVDALDAGADDFVTKPFGLDELLARLRAAARRAAVEADAPVVETPDFTLDAGARRVVKDGRDIRLTPTEWKIVDRLIAHPGKLVSQQQLLLDVWGPAYAKDVQYLRVYMAQLRKKLEPDPGAPRYFVTESGMGYRFEP